MLDMNDLRSAGHSTTGFGPISNPFRRLCFALARPYFTHIAQATNETAIEVQHLQARPVIVPPQEFSKQDLLELRRLFDGLHKDQMAINHRLGSMEDQVAAGLQSGGALKEEVLKIHGGLDGLRGELAMIDSGTAGNEGLHRPGRATSNGEGMTMLRHSAPIALPGTTLVMYAGPYGRFMLRQPDLISDHILAGGFWDEHLKGIIDRTGSTNSSALDAGAYLGFHSVYMARYFRAVYAFEPQVEMYRMLCTNLLLNNCRNVIAMNAGLYDVAGHMRLAEGGEQEIPVPGPGGIVDYDLVGNAAALTFRMASGTGAGAVPVKTVDELAITDLGFMKVDTQGSDLHVVRGARATIARCRPVIAVEFERMLAHGHGHTLDDYYRYFDEIDYAVEVISDRGNGKQMDLLASPR